MADWDASTGLYKMGDRYYDPTIGAFTTLDPLGGGYGYAANNPVNFVDPTGLKGRDDGYGIGGGGEYPRGGPPPPPEEEGTTKVKAPPKQYGHLPRSGEVYYRFPRGTRPGQRLPTGMRNGRSGFQDDYGDIWYWDRVKREWDVQWTQKGRNAFHLAGKGGHSNVNEYGKITHGPRPNRP